MIVNDPYWMERAASSMPSFNLWVDLDRPKSAKPFGFHAPLPAEPKKKKRKKGKKP